jgi:predicted phosphodiesterase
MSTIRALIISDTHNKWPHSLPDSAVDVFIHCGDLTQYGGLPSFRRAIEDIKTVNAELKLIIAGNHDVDLDPAWLEKFAEDDDDVAVGAKCLSLLQS